MSDRISEIRRILRKPLDSGINKFALLKDVAELDETYVLESYKGKVIPDEKPICWADYKNYDELEYNRIVRDCLNFDTRKA